MRKARTIDEILNDRGFFSEKEAQEIKKKVAKETKAYWGGARTGAGRKRLTKDVLSKSMRVSESEAKALQLIRKLDFELTALDLKFLSFAKEKRLKLRSIMSQYKKSP